PNTPELRRRSSRTLVLPESYFQLPGFNFVVREIPSVLHEDDFTIDNFEHKVGRVIYPLLSYFSPPLQNGWYITPEQIQSNRKRPDFVVEYFDNGLYRDIFVEIKRAGGDSLRHALYQSCSSIPQIYGANTLIPSCVYLILARGAYIGFVFEFYPGMNNLINQGHLPPDFSDTYRDGIVPLIVTDGLVQKYPFNTEVLLRDIGSDDHLDIIMEGCIFQFNREHHVPMISALFNHLATYKAGLCFI